MKKSVSETAKKITTEAIKKTSFSLKVKENNEILSMAAGTALVSGLSEVKLNELLHFKNDAIAMVHNLNEESVGVVFLKNSQNLKAGDKATRTHQVLSIPVGNALLGRIINPLGEPLDKKGKVLTKEFSEIEHPAPEIMMRTPVDTPLQTGIKAIDCFTPIGRGQRELILGDRQTGKTAIALDTILNQKETGVICIYCAIGQRQSNTARVIHTLEEHDMLTQSVVVIASGDEEAGMQYIAPYSATAIGEYFMHQGKDVLVVYDDLTAHAQTYRQMSLLLKTPPGREAFPGDIFYLHSRLLERATHLRPKFGGGSLTALPIVLTEAGNISAYIPTNVISITDGQIYLSNDLYQKGIMPAIDTGRSVSRVGGEAQLPAYRSLIGPLKLFYAQFEELESFSKFGMQMDKTTLMKLKRGQAIRSALTQRQYFPVDAITQIGLFMALNEGLLDQMDEKQILKAQEVIHQLMLGKFSDISHHILKREKITDEQKRKMLDVFQKEFIKKGLPFEK